MEEEMKVKAHEVATYRTMEKQLTKVQGTNLQKSSLNVNALHA